MKAKYLSVIAIACAALCTSCDMDLKPIGYLEQDEAISSTYDAERYRASFYTGMRAFASSKYFTYPELQCDMFNGITINGNRMGEIANGTVLSSDENITGYWASLYSLIGNINFFLGKTEPLYKAAVEANDMESAQKYGLYIGEAHFFRGYYYAMLFDRWCVEYKPELGDTPAMGLPIVTEFNPSTDRATYVGRSTMNETIKFFMNEIDLGYNAICEYEEVADSEWKKDAWGPMAIYINHYVIEAMRARIALWLGDYEGAIQHAKTVIDSKLYTMTSIANYANMWVNDASNEIIFMPFESTSELGNAIGATWLGTTTEQADYIPSPKLLTLMQAGFSSLLGKGDIRLTTFAETRSLRTEMGMVPTPTFIKFPGNPSLNTTQATNSVINKPKPFRLSEQYLILAEASYLNGDEETAKTAIAEIWNNRYTKYTMPEVSGDALLELIREQRTIELVGEGFRLSDLRRWKQGFTRDGDYSTVKLPGISKSKVPGILTPAGLKVTYTADDHRYTWPIPADELTVNPQMAGQQNPGY